MKLIATAYVDGRHQPVAVHMIDHGLQRCHDGAERYISEFRKWNGELIGYTGTCGGDGVAVRRMRLDDRFLARDGFSDVHEYFEGAIQNWRP